MKADKQSQHITKAISSELAKINNELSARGLLRSTYTFSLIEERIPTIIETNLVNIVNNQLKSNVFKGKMVINRLIWDTREHLTDYFNGLDIDKDLHSRCAQSKLTILEDIDAIEERMISTYIDNRKDVFIKLYSAIMSTLAIILSTLAII